MGNDDLSVTINGTGFAVSPTTSVAAAIQNAGITQFRRSVSGSSRGPLCGMGACFECRVMIDGLAHRRSCLTLCRDGMEILTDVE
ncbi:MAG: (2Fe-2S)-binding protein [Spirochaetaceae bacterium]|nr:MAG: (2Fe-2S)-binding protein [Spirochaetaceae bacterium]